MLPKKLTLNLCPASFFLTEKPKFVFHGGKEAKEGAGERAKGDIFEVPYEFKKEEPWQGSVRALLQQAHPLLRKKWDAIMDEVEEKQELIRDKLEDTKKIELNKDVIRFLDEDGEELVSIDVAQQILEMKAELADEQNGLTLRGNKLKRGAAMRHGIFNGALRPPLDQQEKFLAHFSKGSRDPRGRGGAGAGAAGPSVVVNEGSFNRAARESRESYEASLKRERQEFLDTVGNDPTVEYTDMAHISPNIAWGDDAAFMNQWPFIHGSEEISELFQETPSKESGYMTNPFRGWNEHKLREVIEEARADDIITFKDISKEIYNNRYKEIKALLKKDNVPDPILDFMDEPGISLFSDDGDLAETYQRLKEADLNLDTYRSAGLPEEFENLKELAPHQQKLKQVIQILGDYIAYTSRLMNLLKQMDYQSEETAKLREGVRAAHLRRPEDETTGAAQRRNSVKRALNVIFPENLSDPVVYISEFDQIFEGDKKKRPITFTDLNGVTMTVDPPDDEKEFLTDYMSSDSAYLEAYEAAELDYSKEGDMDKGEGVKHLNTLLQLGIFAYAVRPFKKSLRDITRELSEAGVTCPDGTKLETTNRRSDAVNLYHALQLATLSDVTQYGVNETPQAAHLKQQYRKLFMRVGAVINRGKKVREQKERIEQLNGKQSILVKVSPERAAEITAQLRATDKFTEEELRRIEDKLSFGFVFVVGSVNGRAVGGAAVSVPIDLGHGFTLDISGGHTTEGIGGMTVGLAKNFEINDEWSFTLHGSTGIGWNVTQPGGAPGWVTGIDGSLIYKVSSGVTANFQAGAGVMTGLNVPVVFAGAGLDWANPEEKYQEALTKGQLKYRLNELNTFDDPYLVVRGNQEKYGQLGALIYQLDNAPVPLDDSAKRAVFMSVYKRLNEQVQENAVEDSSLPLITGIDAKLAVIPGNPPVFIPFIGVKLNWDREIVYRVATDTELVENITDQEATLALTSRYEWAGKADIQVGQRLASSKELIMNVKTGNMMLKTRGEGSIDFGHLAQFEELRKELLKNAKISVDPSDNGLVKLTPHEAHGNVYVYVDPALGDNVLSVANTYIEGMDGGKLNPDDVAGTDLYLSVREGVQLFIKREDINYPFKNRGTFEKTVITISANPVFSQNDIKRKSGWYLFKTPETNWQQKTRSRGVHTEDMQAQGSQGNVMSYAEYKVWWDNSRPDGTKFNQSDRVRSYDVKALRENHRRLEASVTYFFDAANTDTHLREDRVSKIKELAKDSAFIKEYRALATEGTKYVNGTREIDGTKFPENYPELIKKIQIKMGTSLELNSDELNYALLTFAIASFSNIQKEKPAEAKKLYVKFLESFERPMLTSLYIDYYKDETDEAKRKQKVDEAVTWTLNYLKTEVDITGAGAKVEAGTLFASTVGLDKITGLRHLYNYSETSPEFGLVGGKTLDLLATGPEKEAAQFWLKKVSPYVRNISKEDLPNTTDATYEAYEKKIYGTLLSPLALKLVPLVGASLSAAEMATLAEIYESVGPEKTRVTLDASNIEVVKKFLRRCDEVRNAQLAGITKEKEITLDNGFTLVVFPPKVVMGIYKKCGNITGLVNEDFALVHKGIKKIYFAAQAEGYHDVYPDFGRVDSFYTVGLAIPLATTRQLPRQPETPPETPVTPVPEGEIPPGETPPPPPPPSEPGPTPAPAEGNKGVSGNLNGSRTATTNNAETNNRGGE